MTQDKEQRRRKINQLREKKRREETKIVKKKEYENLKNWNTSKYPPTISTMVKRIKRIDPWNTVVNMNSFDSSLIVFFKFKQKGIENVRIVVSGKISWVEFEFADNWYIINVSAVKHKDYGEPICYKSDAKSPIYKKMYQTFSDAKEFIEKYDDVLSFDEDEAKIEAMKDEGLNTFLIIKYF